MSDGNTSLQIALRRIGEQAFGAGAVAMQNAVTKMLLDRGEVVLAAVVNKMQEPPYTAAN